MAKQHSPIEENRNLGAVAPPGEYENGEYEATHLLGGVDHII